MIRTILLNLAACLAVALLISVAIAIGLSRLPSAIVFQTYPERQCIIVEIVNEDKELEKITCAEFEQTEDYAKGNYITKWGALPSDYD